MKKNVNYSNVISVSHDHAKIKHVCILSFSAQREGLLSEASPDEVFTNLFMRTQH